MPAGTADAAIAKRVPRPPSAVGELYDNGWYAPLRKEYDFLLMDDLFV